MTSAKRWLLPDGVEEILPNEAGKLESLRRQLLDLYRSWGYELVITPLIEFLDSLLVGTSKDLDIHTFKIVDQLSGRMMGIRADITPQAARIDAHCLHRDGPVRLCYADSVLHTRPRGLMTSRVPIRIGAELYGHAGVECDIELICLMHETLQVAGIENCQIVLGHVGIFRNLLQEADLDDETEQLLFQAVQRKAFDEIDQILAEAVKAADLRERLQKLTRLSGDESVLEQAKQVFSAASDSVKAELEELVAIAAGVNERLPGISIGFDLCELRGFEYHTGIVFAAYSPGYGRAVAKGGRYNDIGEVFGRARPASGFDSDLKILARLSAGEFSAPKAILAPATTEPELLDKIKELRHNGEVVIQQLGSETENSKDLNYDRKLEKQGTSWQVVQI